jgi:hypothetical protein
MNLFDTLRSTYCWDKIPVILTPKRKSTMTQAVKNVVVTKAVLDKILSSANHEKSIDAKTPETTILQLDRSKNLSRFLEASCDCV